MYLDACIEPWAGGHRDTSMPAARRTNYAFRELAKEIGKRYPQGPTCVTMHGANPGLVSHFLKQALLNIAQRHRRRPARAEDEGAMGALRHAARCQDCADRRARPPGQQPRARNGASSSTPGRAGPSSANRCSPPSWAGAPTSSTGRARAWSSASAAAPSIYLNRPGCTTRVRSWVPTEGPFQGWLISHGEAHSIPDYFTVWENGRAVYRPTAYYAYHPCDDAVLSLHEMVGHNFTMQERTRLLRDDIADGFDELGVLLLGHKRGAYWYGSQLSIHEARRLCPHNNATSLQVNAPALGAVIWAMRNPSAGVVEPDDLDFRTVLDVSMPYLGPVVGVYSDWTPLQRARQVLPGGRRSGRPLAVQELPGRLIPSG